MKNKIKLIAVISAMVMSFVFAGCQVESDSHEHSFSKEWTSDETSHWHAATCEHTEEVSDKAEHTFGEWKTTLEPTEEADGKKERTCTVCSYKEEQSIAKLEHTHTFAETWTSDEANHWHAATCEHTEEVSGKAAHTFGEWNVTKLSTFDTNGEKERTCTVCSYNEKKIISKIPEGFVKVTGRTITGSETWTPSSSVFVSGRSLTIPDLIVCDHEVTRGEYKEVVGSDPSTASAYDKDGNKLTGDDVLNNPVNCVSWYDALVYCNKLSKKEGLKPCYTISGSTDPDSWGTVPTSSNSTWDAAVCDFEADGYRLPTEAEWEWLARGGENYTYAGSNTVGDVAWYTSNTSDTGTREVKTKQANGYGLYDMSGNVWEWCWDWYGSVSSSTAAAGAASGSSRVQRGGSWFSRSSFCWVADRISNDPDSRDNLRGFRVVRSAN